MRSRSWLISSTSAGRKRSLGLHTRLTVIYSVLLTVTVAALAWVVVLFRGQPVFMGAALLAWGDRI
jgi:high-affinity nickel permease